jgi:hypothetical protein
VLAAFRTRGQIPFFFARAAAAMAAAAIRVVVVFNGAITTLDISSATQAKSPSATAPFALHPQPL